MIPSLMATSAAQVIATNTSRISGRAMIRSAALFAALQIVLGFGFIRDLDGFQGLDDPVKHAGRQCWVEDHRLLAFNALEVLDFDNDLDVVRFCDTSHIFVWFVLVCLLAREKCLILGKSQNNFPKLFMHLLHQCSECLLCRRRHYSVAEQTKLVCSISN